MLMLILLAAELQLQAEVVQRASCAGSGSRRMKAEVHLEHQRDSFSFEGSGLEVCLRGKSVKPTTNECDDVVSKVANSQPSQEKQY